MMSAAFKSDVAQPANVEDSRGVWATAIVQLGTRAAATAPVAGLVAYPTPSVVSEAGVTVRADAGTLQSSAYVTRRVGRRTTARILDGAHSKNSAVEIGTVTSASVAVHQATASLKGPLAIMTLTALMGRCARGMDDVIA